MVALLLLLLLLLLLPLVASPTTTMGAPSRLNKKRQPDREQDSSNSGATTLDRDTRSTKDGQRVMGISESTVHVRVTRGDWLPAASTAHHCTTGTSLWRKAKAASQSVELPGTGAQVSTAPEVPRSGLSTRYRTVHPRGLSTDRLPHDAHTVSKSVGRVVAFWGPHVRTSVGGLGSTTRL